MSDSEFVGKISAVAKAGETVFIEVGTILTKNQRESMIRSASQIYNKTQVFIVILENGVIVSDKEDKS